jgi:hypothetical protein
MGDVVSLKSKRGTARDQLLAMVQHQAQVQGKSVAQYLRELQAQAERNGQEREVSQAVAPRVPRDKYTYLTRLGRFHAEPIRTGSASSWHQRLRDLLTRIPSSKEAFGEG